MDNHQYIKYKQYQKFSFLFFLIQARFSFYKTTTTRTNTPFPAIFPTPENEKKGDTGTHTRYPLVTIQLYSNQYPHFFPSG